MKFFDIGNATVSEHYKSFELINRGYTPDVRKAGQWFETTSDVYDYFLGCMPPRHFSGSAFMMCEASTCTLSDAFIHIDGRFYCLTVEHNGQHSFADTVAMFRHHTRDEVAA